MLRRETKRRARALQLLYAWEIQDGAPVDRVASGIARLGRPASAEVAAAEALARAVVEARETLDRVAADAAEHWRLERIGVVERNILRLGIHELTQGEVPPKVAIDEAVRLAHWFGGTKSGRFVNGVLDHVAHAMGRL